MDETGPAHYGNPEDKYKINITRVDNSAVLKWDFPENEYKTINVYRFPHLVTGPVNGIKNAKAKDGARVVTTMEGKSQYTDPLPDINSDYWYWFRITLKSGVVVDQGPIKAEYANQ